MICFSSEIYFLYQDGIHISIKHFFYLRMGNPSQQVRNGISIFKRNIHFESFDQEIKNSSAGWPGKKTHPEFFARAHPPEH